MSAHYLLSSAARSLSVESVARFSDEEAREEFKRIRWADNGGEPYCPRCGCRAVYAYRKRPVWKCKQCDHQFSVTSGTIFASRKLPHRKILQAVAYIANSPKGISAITFSRYIGVNFKTAFVILQKIREALGIDVKQASFDADAEIEADGAYFGGYVKPKNLKSYRRDRRLRSNRSGKRLSMVVVRQRGGRTLPMVFGQEDAAVAAIRSHVPPGTTLHVDSAKHWEVLAAHYPLKTVNHQKAFVEQDGACTNQAESFFSRARRSEIGVHHHIAGPHLEAYAVQFAWLEDHRRLPNGTVYELGLGLCLKHPVSRLWKGYWQGAASRRPETAVSTTLNIRKAVRERRAAERRKSGSRRDRSASVEEVMQRIRTVARNRSRVTERERRRRAPPRKSDPQYIEAARSASTMKRFVLGQIRDQKELLTLKDLTFRYMSERSLNANHLGSVRDALRLINRFLHHQCKIGVLRAKRVGRIDGWEFVQ